MSKRPRASSGSSPGALFSGAVLLFRLSPASVGIYRKRFACVVLPAVAHPGDRLVSTDDASLTLRSCPVNTTLVVAASQTLVATAVALGLTLAQLSNLIDERGLRIVTQEWVSNCLGSVLGGVAADVALAAVPHDGIATRAVRGLPVALPARRVAAAGERGVAVADSFPALPRLSPLCLHQHEGEVPAPLRATPASAYGCVSRAAPLLNASAWRHVASATIGPAQRPRDASRYRSTRLVDRPFGLRHIVLPGPHDLVALQEADGRGGGRCFRLLTININSFKTALKKSASGLARLLGAADGIAIQETRATDAELLDLVDDLMASHRHLLVSPPDTGAGGASSSAAATAATADDGFAVFSNGCSPQHQLGVAVLVRKSWAAGAHVLGRDLPLPEPEAQVAAEPAALAAAVGLPDGLPDPDAATSREVASREVSSSEVTSRVITVLLPAAGLTIVCVHRPYVAPEFTGSLARRNVIRAWPAALAAHLQLLRALPGALPIAVMGDLNAQPLERRNHHLWDVLAPAALRDATAGTTEQAQYTQFPAGAYAFQRLDYVLLDPALQARLVRCSGRVLSVGAPAGDHVPVFAALRAPAVP